MREDWVEVELGSVLKTTSGGTPSRSNLKYYSGSIPWVKSGELNQNTILETEESISEEAVKNSSAKIFPKGTLLIALYGATIGKLAFLGIDAASNQAVCGIFVNEVIESKFLYYYLFHNRRKLIEQGTGGAQPNISQTILKKLPIIVAPLPEQRAIVARIEELFSELDHSVANLQAAQAKLEIYRQAVLKKAFEGGFTEENTKRINNLPIDWNWIKSGDLFSFVTSGSRGWAKYYSDSGAIFIRITNLDFDTLDLNLNQDKIQHVSPPNDSEGIRTKVQEGDFLFSITGYLGMFAIAPKLDDAYVNQHVSLCRPKEGFNKRFVGYWLISKSGGIRYLNENKKGAVKAGLNLDDLKNIPIPLPIDKRVQDVIVQEIESRLSVADKMAETIQTSLKKAEALRQSILKKAFEGQLLSEAEVEACRKEADWEPADRLFERIKSERKK